MNCANGHENPDDARFCGACGGALESVTSATTGTSTLLPSGDGGRQNDRLAVVARRHLPILVSVASVAIIILGVGAWRVVGSGNETHDVRGSLVLFDADTAQNDCIGEGGYADVEPGMQVTVSNEAGRTLGTGVLSGGNPNDGFFCDYKFTVEDVGSAKFYAVEFGSQRGDLEYSRAEIEKDGWHVDLTLGDVSDPLEDMLGN